MPDLVGNPEDRFSHNEAHIIHAILLTGDRRQTKQFCFLDAEGLVVGESQSSYRRSAGKYHVKPPRPEGDSQTINTY